MLVNLLPNINLTLEEIKLLVPESTVKIIMDYVAYISAQNSKTMLTAGIILMATTSAAAFRSIHSIMAEIQGASRFQGVFALIFSFIFSLLFLAVIYFSAVVMVTGDWLIRFITNLFPVLYGLEIWSLIRFPVLFVIFIIVIYAIYRITAPRNLKGTFFPGAIIAAVILVLVSAVFSQFIGFSTRYPLVYGSLAAIIIYMLWMYACGQILIMGNAYNVVLRRHKAAKKAKVNACKATIKEED